MTRVMGLDYGSKTVGVAVSDPLGLTAQGVEIIRRTQENKLRRTLARIEELAAQYEVTEIVLGYPKNMNNTIGERAEKSLAFREMLMRRTGLPVVMWDERLTTVAANRTLMETGVRREHRKEYVDMIAAVYILQGYLDRIGNTGESALDAEAACTEAERTEEADRQ
ncbi:MAG: Holliday junction resolvase RuvX [Lachnospiraceae bacterium]|nr:Holliday junction resolvase RuvX [Lachnospiraceae bacterium]